MQRLFAVALLVLVSTGTTQAAGILIPKEKELPPLAMLNHKVNISIEDQVAVTKLEQTFRNHTDRRLEATYVFPVPEGASVRRFSMWVNGTEVPGEMIDSKKAKKIYTEILRRTQDPGLLEYMDNNLFRVRVFPVMPKSDLKVTLSYTSVAKADQGIVEYVYPLKTDGKAIRTLEKFTIDVHLKSQHSIQNIYSPTHAISTTRPNDHQAHIRFEKNEALLDRNFQLFYSADSNDVGLTTLAHRPVPGSPGFFMLLASPREELSKKQQVPRDIVLVLDTSGSMRGKRIIQARNALKFCLSKLRDQDRFGIVNFSTVANRYADALQEASKTKVAEALRWVDKLQASGGTCIQDALLMALEMRHGDRSRPFTVIFFTDGQPTIGETDPKKIQETVLGKNTANTRIFTFGVGNDVNATMLDQIAEESRALSTYVRERDDIETKISSLYAKIRNPVLTNLKLAVSDGVKLSEVYPPQLPDLFHGTQLVVFGRYTGDGQATIKLTGNAGKEAKEYEYHLSFPKKTEDPKEFLEHLWARRKVGYLLDQIRINGKKKELVDEVVRLAKRYSITTPFTSFLIMPDQPLAVAGRAANRKLPNVRFNLGGGLGGPGVPPPGLSSPSGEKKSVADFIKQTQKENGEAAQKRTKLAAKDLDKAAKLAEQNKSDGYLSKLRDAKLNFDAQIKAEEELRRGNLHAVQTGKIAFELSCYSNMLRSQNQLKQTAQRWIGTRNCLEVGGVWIDEAYNAKRKIVNVKAMSNAYFRILERHPETRKIFSISNHMVWVTPSGVALVLDQNNGVEEMKDAEIDRLFVVAKK